MSTNLLFINELSPTEARVDLYPECMQKLLDRTTPWGFTYLSMVSKLGIRYANDTRTIVLNGTPELVRKNADRLSKHGASIASHVATLDNRTTISSYYETRIPEKLARITQQILHGTEPNASFATICGQMTDHYFMEVENPLHNLATVYCKLPNWPDEPDIADMRARAQSRLLSLVPTALEAK